MAGNAQQAADEPITDINVTPLVDICLVLVIIFMAIAPLAMVAGVSVLHSHGKAAVGKTSLAESVKVKLTLNGRLTVNGVPVAPAALAQSISAALLRCKDKTVKKLNARIWRAVEKAIVDGRDSVDLERGQVEHVLETLEAWDMKGDVGKVGFWGDLVSHIESALREPEAESLSGANGAVEKPRKVKV